MTPDQLRDRMKANPFAPVGATPDLRIASALEYVAFYLGEIEAHLSVIASETRPNTANATKTAGALMKLAEMLPTLLAKR